jgi:integrase
MFLSPVTGDMYGPDCVGRIHKKLLARAGIKGKIRFHDLRHTFATMPLKNGVDVKTISHILGHYSAGFTLDTYTHVTGDMKKEAAKRIGEVIAI